MESKPPAPGSTPPSPGPVPAQVPSSAPGEPAHISKAGSTPAMPASGTSATAVPNVASVSDDERLKLACEKISGSIFHVKFESRDKSDLEAYIQQLIAKLPAARKDEWHKKRDEIVGAISETTTGFVVGENQGYLFILTCAHAFQACFNRSNPISATSLRKLFKISVRCGHEELKHNQRGPRVYTEAEVYRVDSRKDMLLLRVQKQGSMSHNLRGQEDIHDDNEHGYNFSAIEVNITSEAGSSGAPVVDTAGIIKKVGTSGSGAGSSSSSLKRSAGAP
ncbi:unnamed protein product [Miscanthus lutarioriparius]|uniref:Uncharacterized protein n=1 Tax=Miscanthus lutarioriparius TaxID=422564 RepID=A0A811RFQ7_9POAL|nr:unnamed protein product [Miscanthus lutarioriparius]